eukprot:g2093.t1
MDRIRLLQAWKKARAEREVENINKRNTPKKGVLRKKKESVASPTMRSLGLYSGIKEEQKSRRRRRSSLAPKYGADGEVENPQKENTSNTPRTKKQGSAPSRGGTPLTPKDTNARSIKKEKKKTQALTRSKMKSKLNLFSAKQRSRLSNVLTSKTMDRYRSFMTPPIKVVKAAPLAQANKVKSSRRPKSTGSVHKAVKRSESKPISSRPRSLGDYESAFMPLIEWPELKEFDVPIPAATYKSPPEKNSQKMVKSSDLRVVPEVPRKPVRLEPKPPATRATMTTTPSPHVGHLGTAAVGRRVHPVELIVGNDLGIRLTRDQAANQKLVHSETRCASRD